jgi:Predicted AAA-ATPase/PD-(D/E)XK nuclease superfamily
MIKIPYGESDFHKVRTEAYFYQDKTAFIEKLELWQSSYLIFLRPRRFGKSLFVSMLHHYYGLEHRADFQTLFGDLYIGKQPTKRANNYLVLSFEFSRIDTSSHESTYAGFMVNVIEGARTFLYAYEQFYSPEDIAIVLAQSSPEAVVKTLFGITKTKKLAHKIYLLIDEYDHFANELLSFDLERFKGNVSSNGFVRKFYESFKTAARDGVIDRIFITGVSPITLDSLTSGFNISSNISTNPIFHEMMGFTATEVEALLFRADIPAEAISVLYSDLKEWYDGYLFAVNAQNHLFNPDMVLYFLQQYRIDGNYPQVMLDTNVVSDYRKVRNYFRIGGRETEKFELLDKLIKDGYIDFPLTQLFNLEAEFSDNDFLSLLYYMGMLSYREQSMVAWRCEIPNYVIKKLYFEYFASIFLANTRFEKSTRPIMQAITDLIGEANPEPFFKVVEHVLSENQSNRDEMVYGEKHLQTLMIGLLCPYESYFIHSEYESRRGYPDIFLEKKPNTIVKYEIVLELKYVKKKEEDKLPQVIEQAQTQLDEYMQSERFSRPDVRGFYVVFLGGEVYQWEEWKP